MKKITERCDALLFDLFATNTEKFTIYKHRMLVLLLPNNKFKKCTCDAKNFKFRENCRSVNETLRAQIKCCSTFFVRFFTKIVTRDDQHNLFSNCEFREKSA